MDNTKEPRSASLAGACAEAVYRAAKKFAASRNFTDLETQAFSDGVAVGVEAALEIASALIAANSHKVPTNGPPTSI